MRIVYHNYSYNYIKLLDVVMGCHILQYRNGEESICVTQLILCFFVFIIVVMYAMVLCEFN